MIREAHKEAHGSPSPSPLIKPEPEPAAEPATLSAREVIGTAPLSPRDRVQGGLGCIALFVLSAVFTVAAGVGVVLVTAMLSR